LDLANDSTCRFGITSSDLNIFGAALYYNSSETGLVAGFDTAGYGSKDHPVVVKEVKDEEEEQSTVPLGLFLALLIVLLIIVIALSIALALSFIVGKKGATEERSSPVPEVKEEEEKALVPEKGPEKGPSR